VGVEGVSGKKFDRIMVGRMIPEDRARRALLALRAWCEKFYRRHANNLEKE